jgi:hypothetical protein
MDWSPRLQSVGVLIVVISRSRIGIAFCRGDCGVFIEGEVLIMRFFTIAIAGSVFAGMTALALANPAMLPKHPGYPSGGEFANDTGRKNLTYSQSIEEAARSGDTTMGTTLINPENTRLLEPQVVDPLPIVRGANIQIEPQVKEGMQMPKK